MTTTGVAAFDEKATLRAKKALSFSFEEAQQRKNLFVEPEHILYGLIREGAGVAAAVLENLDVDLEDLLDATSKKLITSEKPCLNQKLSDKSRKVLVNSDSYRKKLNHNYIGTEHVLLGLFHPNQKKSIHYDLLEKRGITENKVVTLTMTLLGENVPSQKKKEQPLIYQSFKLASWKTKGPELSSKNAEELMAGLRQLNKDGYEVSLGTEAVNGIPTEIIVKTRLDKNVKAVLFGLASELGIPYQSGNAYIPLSK